jgi:hypothetical protein
VKDNSVQLETNVRHERQTPGLPVTVRSIEKLGAAFDVLNIGNPVALPSREARLLRFTIEICRRTAKERLVDTFERVDADNRVKVVVDSAGHDRHYAAPSANVELRSSSAECVLGYEGAIFNH